jgi:hypothetical protein
MHYDADSSKAGSGCDHNNYHIHEEVCKIAPYGGMHNNRPN